MKNNPFVLPGLGQSGAMSENPILASMEMMRQAWEGLAKAGNMDPSAMGSMMSIEEMDKRISDLKAVENWLRMNLSMLGSTIRGMEVQRATLATLKSVVETGMSAAKSGADTARARSASPLDDVLRTWQGAAPGTGSAATHRAESPGEASPEPRAPEAPAASGPAAEDKASDAEAGASAAEPPATDPAAAQADVLGAAATAAQGWWNLLQQQFQTLAAATAASAEGAMSDLAEAGAKAARQAASGATSGVAGRKPRATKAAKTTRATKSAAKSAAKSSRAGKSGAVKTAAKKTATKTAAKAAKRSATARKSAS